MSASTITLIVAVAVLAIGTYAFRLAGPLLHSKVTLSARTLRLLNVGVVVIFGALVVTSTFLDGQQFAGFAKPIGVLVAGVLAWRKAPFIVIVIAAAATTAVLRLLGVP